MADWRIAPLTPHRVTDLAACHIASWREAYGTLVPAHILDGFDLDRSAITWERRRAAGTHQLPIALVGDELVGFAATAPRRNLLAHDPTAILADPAYRAVSPEHDPTDRDAVRPDHTTLGTNPPDPSTLVPDQSTLDTNPTAPRRSPLSPGHSTLDTDPITPRPGHSTLDADPTAPGRSPLGPSHSTLGTNPITPRPSPLGPGQEPVTLDRISLTPDPFSEIELEALYVRKAWHGTGLADALLEASGSPRTLWVFAEYPRAQAFYRRHGFADTGIRRTDPFTLLPEQFWRR
ncbi:GNAT family N-acetyltransferase [Nocardia lasii]|uniref:GNAT family N-acetyltransferase n=1 Tax=Nocardia lasii TaxID=1616107 RepID=A0ABW1JXE3_9NOCA